MNIMAPVIAVLSYAIMIICGCQSWISWDKHRNSQYLICHLCQSITSSMPWLEPLQWKQLANVDGTRKFVMRWGVGREFCTTCLNLLSLSLVSYSLSCSHYLLLPLSSHPPHILSLLFPLHRSFTSSSFPHSVFKERVKNNMVRLRWK